MKKILPIIGATVVILVLIVVSFVGYATYMRRTLDASSKAYIDNLVPRIISTWSQEEIIREASPQLLQILHEKPELLDQQFREISKLGKLLNYGGANGSSNMSYTTNQGQLVTANYTASAKFENGDAQIGVRLVQISAQWQLLLFEVNSPLFLK